MANPDQELVELLSKVVDSSVSGLVSKGIVAPGHLVENKSDTKEKEKKEKDAKKLNKELSKSIKKNNLDAMDGILSQLKVLENTIPKKIDEVNNNDKSVFSNIVGSTENDIKKKVESENASVFKKVVFSVGIMFDKTHDVISDTVFHLFHRTRSVLRMIITKSIMALEKLHFFSHFMLIKILKKLGIYTTWWDKLKKWFLTLLAVGGLLTLIAYWDDLKTWFEDHWKEIVAFWTMFSVSPFATFMRGFLKTFTVTVVDYFLKFFGKVRGFVKAVTPQKVKGFFSTLKNVSVGIKDLLFGYTTSSKALALEAKNPKLAKALKAIRSVLRKIPFYGEDARAKKAMKNVLKGRHHMRQLLIAKNADTDALRGFTRMFSKIKIMYHRAMMRSSLKAAKSLKMPLVTKLVNLIKGIGSGAWKAVKFLFSFIHRMGGKLISGVGSFFKTIITHIPLLGRIVPAISKVLGVLGKFLSAPVLATISFIFGFVESFYGSEGSFGDRIVLALTAGARVAWDFMITGILGLAADVVGGSIKLILRMFGYDKDSGIFKIIDDYIMNFKLALEMIADILEAIVMPIIAAVKDTLMGLWNIGKGIIKLFSGDFKGGISDIIQGAIEPIIRLFSNLGTTIADVLYKWTGIDVRPFFKRVSAFVDWIFGDGFFNNIKLIFSNILDDGLRVLYEILNDIWHTDFIAEQLADVNASIKRTDRALRLAVMTGNITTKRLQERAVELANTKRNTTEYAVISAGLNKTIKEMFDSTNAKNLSSDKVDQATKFLAELKKHGAGMWKNYGLDKDDIASMSANLTTMNTEFHKKLLEIGNTVIDADAKAKEMAENALSNAKEEYSGLKTQLGVVTKKMSDKKYWDGATKDTQRGLTALKNDISAKLAASTKKLNSIDPNALKEMLGKTTKKAADYIEPKYDAAKKATTDFAKGLSTSETAKDITFAGRKVVASHPVQSAIETGKQGMEKIGEFSGKVINSFSDVVAGVTDVVTKNVGTLHDVIQKQTNTITQQNGNLLNAIDVINNGSGKEMSMSDINPNQQNLGSMSMNGG